MQNGRLTKGIGPGFATAVVVANMVGAGIFTTPGLLAEQIGSAPWILASWLLGGVIALTGALCYAELGTRLPYAGGDYVYLRQGWGPLPAFLSGWMSFLVGFSAPIAAGALGFVAYLSVYVPALRMDSGIVLLNLPLIPVDLTPGTLCALLIVFVLTVVHYAGLRPGGVMQTALTAVKVGGILVLIILGFASGKGDVGRLLHTSSITGQTVAFPAFTVSLIFVIFSYSGWNAAAYVAEEMREHRRSLPFSLLAGTLGVTALYLGLNALFLYASPISDLRGVVEIGDHTVRRLFGSAYATWLSGFFCISILGSMSSMVIAGPRVYFAMARDGLFPQGFARVHARTHTPAKSIIFQGLWTCVLVLSGTLEQLIMFTGFMLALFSALTVSSLFRIRAQQAGEDSHFTATGYPITPVVFISASVWIMAYTLANRPMESLYGLLLTATGLPLYAYRHWRGNKRSTFASPAHPPPEVKG